MSAETGTLYLIPTPIGNMADLTRRSIEILEQVDLVACEDTRHSGRLLKALGLNKQLLSYHDLNERTRAGQLVEILAAGQSVAIISDAGSPGISDPAYRVVRTAIDHGVPIVPLPGATSIIPALTASGLPTDRFFFEGFLPNKSGARRTRLGKLVDFDHTLVFFESPHRIEKSLGDMLTVLGNRSASLARELTKLHEEFRRGSLSELIASLSEKNTRGEIVVVVAGKGLTVKTGRSDEK